MLCVRLVRSAAWARMMWTYSNVSLTLSREATLFGIIVSSAAAPACSERDIVDSILVWIALVEATSNVEGAVSGLKVGKIKVF